jgi:hypothetical protein
MRFTVIEGGKSKQDIPVANISGPSADDVRKEAARRCEALGINRLRVRERVMGAPVPPDLRHLGLQIEFAAEKLVGLSPIPADYHSDGYWPA